MQCASTLSHGLLLEWCNLTLGIFGCNYGPKTALFVIFWQCCVLDLRLLSLKFLEMVNTLVKSFVDRLNFTPFTLGWSYAPKLQFTIFGHVTLILDFWHSSLKCLEMSNHCSSIFDSQKFVHYAYRWTNGPKGIFMPIFCLTFDLQIPKCNQFTQSTSGQTHKKWHKLEKWCNTMNLSQIYTNVSSSLSSWLFSCDSWLFVSCSQ